MNFFKTSTLKRLPFFVENIGVEPPDLASQLGARPAFQFSTFLRTLTLSAFAGANVKLFFVTARKNQKIYFFFFGRNNSSKKHLSMYTASPRIESGCKCSAFFKTRKCFSLFF